MRGIIGGRLTSSISCDGVFVFLEKKKQDQVAEGSYSTLLVGLAFTGVHKWALFLLLPFRLQAKPPC